MGGTMGAVLLSVYTYGNPKLKLKQLTQATKRFNQDLDDLKVLSAYLKCKKRKLIKASWSSFGVGIELTQLGKKIVESSNESEVLPYLPLFEGSQVYSISGGFTHD
jgi:hypothetical protein